MKRAIFGVVPVFILAVVLCACGKDTSADAEPSPGDRQGLPAANESGVTAAENKGNTLSGDGPQTPGDGQGLPAGGTWETGTYLKGKQSDLILTGEWNVMTMDAADETVSFEGLEDGDVIRVYITMVLETWPGQTTVYAVEWLEDGEVQDISPELIEELGKMGWLE